MYKEIPNENYKDLKQGVKSFRDDRLLNPEKQYKPNIFGKVMLLLIFVAVIGLMILSQIDSVNLEKIKLFLISLLVVFVVIMLSLSIYFMFSINTNNN